MKRSFMGSICGLVAAGVLSCGDNEPKDVPEKEQEEVKEPQKPLYKTLEPAVLEALRNKCDGRSYTIEVKDYPGQSVFVYDATAGSFHYEARHQDGYVRDHELEGAIERCVEEKGIKKLTWKEDGSPVVMPSEEFRALPEYKACHAQLLPVIKTEHFGYQDSDGNGVVNLVIPITQYADTTVHGEPFDPLQKGKTGLQNIFADQLAWHAKLEVGKGLYRVNCQE